MTLFVEKLSGPDALELLGPDWELLDTQLSPRTPFTSPLWAMLWWKHLRQTRAWARHEFFVHTVRDHTGRLMAIAPLVVTHRPAYGPLRLRILQFFGADDGGVTEHRRVICREEDEIKVIQALTDHLRGAKAEWDLFLWTGIRDKGSVGNPHGDGIKAYKQIPEYVVSLPNDWASLRAGLSPNMKEKIRKSYKLLARDGHAFIFRVIERPEEIPAAIGRFFALHMARAQLRQAIKHRDYFADASQRMFIFDYARHMAERRQLRIFELEIGGSVVASRLAFVLGDEVYLYYSGYDPTWRKQSVMTTLMCEFFKWAIERKLRLVNLSTGNDRSKLRWRPGEVWFHHTSLASPTLRGRVASWVFNLSSRRMWLLSFSAIQMNALPY